MATTSIQMGCQTALTVLFLSIAGGAFADRVPLGAIERNYGLLAETGRTAGCSGLGAEGATIGGSDCPRFADAFDLSELNPERITSLTLTLQFVAPGDAEVLWYVNPGSGAVRGGNGSAVPLLLSGGGMAEIEQSFDFDASLDVFDSIIATPTFVLGIAAAQAGASPGLLLRSATLRGWEAPATLGVPEPGSLALASLAVLGAIGIGRRRR